MAGLYASDTQLAGRMRAPQLDVSGLLQSGNMITQALGSVNAKEKDIAKTAEEQRRWDLSNNRAELQASREEDRYKQGLAKEAATNDALSAVLNPNQFTASKVSAERTAIEDSLRNLSPTDRAIAQQQLANNYNSVASGKGWADAALANNKADIGSVMSAKANDYALKAKTPGTLEYNAALKAEQDNYKWEQGIAHSNRMAEIGASKADRKEETYPMFTKQPDGSLVSVEVPKSQLDSFKAQGYSLGKLSNIPAAKDPKDGKGSYSQKDVDALVSKFDPWTITGGSKNEATDLISSLKKVHVGTGPGQIKEKDFNDVIGSALTISSNGDSFSKSLFEDVVKSNLLKNEKVAEVVGDYKKPDASTKSVDVPSTQPSVIPTSNFTLPKEGATITLANIKKDSELLRNGGFGPAKSESYIRDKIDSKYGIGAYDRVAR